MSLCDLVRRHAPQEYLITAAYHTPNGPLHLGHIGGPFLSADVLARHLQTLGHSVLRITGTDALESYVLLKAQQTGQAPAAVAAHYAESARRSLRDFDIHQDEFIDMSGEPWATMYREASLAAAQRLRAEGRLEVASVRLPKSRRSGRFVIGPFAQGRCPACGAPAAGTSCEACGMWFSNADLRDARPRMNEDGDIDWEPVPVVRIRGGEDFRAREIERRFPPGNLRLFQRYVDFNGASILATHPLGWGVPWQGPEAFAGLVQVSYGLGSYAASQVIAARYAHLSPGGSDPFSRTSAVTTIVTGGYDAALPCMFLLALTSNSDDWQPFKRHVLGRFLLLDGKKFSTGAGHLIGAQAYADAKLSTDAFRLYAGRIFSKDTEADFRPADFCRFVTDRLHGALDSRVRSALRTAELAPAAAPRAQQIDRIATALSMQAAALDSRDADLQRATRVIDEWLGPAGADLAQEGAYWWLKTLAVLCYPFMPRWSGRLWQCLGGAGAPRLEGFEAPGPVQAAAYEGFEPLAAQSLQRLMSGAAAQP